VSTDLVAFVDDDHRVAGTFLLEIETAARNWPDASLYCGKILPDWDGSEPGWVHDQGAYALYPLPVPKQDFGAEPRLLTLDDRLPGGGNLIARRSVFDNGEKFSEDLGPRGHNLGGGEDTEFIIRALEKGEKLLYCPAIVQYHYVDLERFRLGYLLIKCYQRSLSATAWSLSGEVSKVPRYMWRKLAEYAFQALFSLRWKRTRFFLMRIASTCGEIKAYRNAALQSRSDRTA
jgi:GT2 family glycosyltransferase